MSVAIRHPLRGEPLPGKARSTLAAALDWARGVVRPRCTERTDGSVFHRLAASDLAFRDVAYPFLPGSPGR